MDEGNHEKFDTGQMIVKNSTKPGDIIVGGIATLKTSDRINLVKDHLL